MKGNNEKVKETLIKLEEGVKSVFQSNRFKNYLEFLSKFHHYSANNTLLIAMQKPNASLVAGFKKWGDMGRKVCKGEKGIKILRPEIYEFKTEVNKIDPVTYKNLLDENSKEIKEIQVKKGIKFKLAYVFDVSQTEGKEIPNLIDELKGSINNKDDIFEAIRNVSKVPIIFETINDGAKGYFNCKEKLIVIKENMSDIQTIKVMIHELVHSRLHNEVNNKSRESKEIEAEGVAFTVLNSIGVDTSDYSFGYVAAWSGEKGIGELKDTLHVIQQESNKLICELKDELENMKSKETGIHTLQSEKEDKQSINNRINNMKINKDTTKKESTDKKINVIQKSKGECR